MSSNQNQTILGPFLAILAALGLTVFIPMGLSNRPTPREAGGNSTPPSTNSSAIVEAAEPPGDERVLGPLIKFLNLDENPRVAPPPATGNSAVWRRLELEIGGRATLARLHGALKGSGPGRHAWAPQFLIVTIPDPVDSAQGEQSDILLDTLQNALKLDRFVLDRYYLPWLDYRRAAARALSSRDDSPGRWYTSEPGLLVFRDTRDDSRIDTGDSRRLLLVFLVGETPVFGIHKEAFARSVALIRKLGGPGNDRTIPVLGPYFSGAAESLAQALEAAFSETSRPGQGLEFDLISGSATSMDKGRFDRLASGRVDFYATVIPDEYVKRELIRYITSHNSGTTQIAWLTESNTGYGGYAEEPQDQQGEGEARYRLVEYPFPLHISQLRAIAEAKKDEGRARNVAPTPEHLRVEIPTAVLDTARDTVPSLAPVLTSAFSELVLAQIFRSIREQGIRYVGITATDPRDVAFLARLLREYCPNTQLLIVESNQLYLHPDFQSDFHGALVGSTYPLFPRSQVWTPQTAEVIDRLSLDCSKVSKLRGAREVDGFSSSLQKAIQEVAARSRSQAPQQTQFVTFASGSHQGFYNAALALRRNHKMRLWRMALDGRTWEPDPTIVDLRLLGYGIPFEASLPKPPIWISVVGNDSFWPIRYVEFDQVVARYQKLVPPEKKLEDYLYNPIAAFMEAVAAEETGGAVSETHPELFLAYVPFPFDRTSLVLILGLILFGLVNVVFYFLELDWGPASCFDRGRLAGAAHTHERIYLAACIVPLWMLLTGLGLLACIPSFAEPWVNHDAALVVFRGPGLGDRALFLAYYIAVGYLALWGFSLWATQFLARHDRNLDEAIKRLPGEGRQEITREGIERERKQNRKNIESMKRFNRWLDIVTLLVVPVIIVALVAWDLIWDGRTIGLLGGTVSRRLLALMMLLALPGWLSLLGGTVFKGLLASGLILGAFLATEWVRLSKSELARRMRGPSDWALERRASVTVLKRIAAEESPYVRIIRRDGFPAALGVIMLVLFFLTLLNARLTITTWLLNLIVLGLSLLVSGALLGVLVDSLLRRVGRSFWTILLRCVLVQLAVMASFMIMIIIYYTMESPLSASQADAHLIGHAILLFERSVHLHGGVSLLTMAIFLALAIYAWGYTQLRRLYLLQYFYPSFDGYDLELVRVASVDKIRTEGRNLVVVAGVSKSRKTSGMPDLLRFRVFDINGQRVVDRPESRLTEKASLIADLKSRLGSLRDRKEISRFEKRRIVEQVRAIVGPSRLDWLEYRGGDQTPEKTSRRWRVAEAGKIRNTRTQLDDLVARPTPTIIQHAGVWFILALLVSAAWIGRLRVNAVPPFENPFLSLLVWAGLCAFLFVWVHWLIHLIFLIKPVGKLLYQLSLLPMQSAFQRLPQPIASLMGRLLYAERPRLSICRVPVHYLERIVADYLKLPEAAMATWASVLNDPEGDESVFRRVSQRFAERSELVPEMTGGIFTGHDVGLRARAFVDTQEDLAQATRLLWEGMITEWTRRDAEEAYPSRRPSEPGPAAPAGPRPLGQAQPEGAADQGESKARDSDDERREAEDQTRRHWVRLVEDFIAIQVVIYLSQLIFQGRNLLYGLLFGSLLMLLAVLSYPLQPHQLLVSSILTMVLIVAVIGVAIFVRMERDPLICRITGKQTEGVQLDLQFVTKIAPFVLPAAFILIGSLFPDTWRWLATLLNTWSR